VPEARARGAVTARLSRNDRARARRELAEIYRLIGQLRRPGGDCLTCATELLERRPPFSVATPAPYKADLALSYRCGNRCPHCYNEAERSRMVSLERNDWLRIIDRLAAIGVPHLIFTGGEPTLHPELLRLVGHASRLGLVTGLNSNGRRLADDQLVGELAAAGLDHLQITLASCRQQVHDRATGVPSFSETVRGIANAVASEIHTITNTTLSRANRDHAVEIVDFVHELGVRSFAMNSMIASGGGLDRDGSPSPLAIPPDELAPALAAVRDRARELGMRFLWYTPTEYCRLDPLELELGTKRCNAAEYTICVEPNGDVLPCQSYYEPAGNLLRDPWESIWNAPLMAGFRDRCSRPQASELPEACWDCPDLEVCGGGCPLDRAAAAAEESAGACRRLTREFAPPTAAPAAGRAR
jgi:radical SAM protein with 4Fe4S-binding SPASM domain